MIRATAALHRPGLTGFIYSGLEFIHGDTIKIVVVSDVHLGSENSEKEAFLEFLGSLRDDGDITDLVLLGDIVEMWHRDASGIFLENMDLVVLLKELQKKLTLHWVVGNHDYHLLKLKNRAPHYNYPFEFKENLELKDGHHTYRFIHGYEFEYGNETKFIRPMLELLCHVMSDSDGVPKDDLWAYLTKKMSGIQYSVITERGDEGNLRITTGSIVDPPEIRLKNRIDAIERQAYEEVHQKPHHTLIFGHTHSPFICVGGNLINTGSWEKNSRPNKTYVVLEKGSPRLFVYGGDEIRERKKMSVQ